MFNKTEKEEKGYLKYLLQQVDVAIRFINERIQSQSAEVKYLNTHLQEYKSDMDHLEKNALREAITNTALLGDHAVDKKKRLLRLRNVPFFGRIDFTTMGTTIPEPIYVGVHNFRDDDNTTNLVFDWRAPISSMFYDFEPGEAFYETLESTITGNIELKRQFRIRNGEMEYMFESDITVQDDVLQKELNQASSAKMKNIVATIQREQNVIIRNEEAHHLIIQGVAGSGKTSIALHRIAFLLYRFKETISSTDILIISPNKVFASYISNVLPELGEETIEETSMEEIANELVEYQVKFQSFSDQVSELLSKTDQKLIERILFKSSGELLKQIDDYIVHLENEGFKPIDIIVAKKPVPAWFIKESFLRHSRRPLLERFNEVVRDIVNSISLHYRYDVMYKERTELHNTIRKMFPSANLRILYKSFYEWLERPDLLRLKTGSVYEYSDVYPLLYFKMKLEGLKPYNKVKHLVIDEMQDYSCVQYKVLSSLFTCKKTILGDINQSINPYSSSGLETIQSIFSDSTCISILKSYRSTYEITQFSKKIRQNLNVEAIERHGEEPSIHSFKYEAEELQHIKQFIKHFLQSNYNSLGIVCKTQAQCDKLHEELKGEFQINLLHAASVAFGSGIVITSAHLAKGLEFDNVIVPFITNKNYITETDRQMLYVACTRAMHRLSLTHTGTRTSLIS